jgi:hypothetical protein
MKTFTLVGINAIGEVAKLGKDVISFVDEDRTFSITMPDISYVQLKTNQSVYNLTKHHTINYYNATLTSQSGKVNKIQIHLKAVSGWLKVW